MLSTPGDTVNESTVTLLPDGRLLATHRLATAPNVDRRLYSISDDGGVTYTLQGAIGVATPGQSAQPAPRKSAVQGSAKC